MTHPHRDPHPNPPGASAHERSEAAHRRLAERSGLPVVGGEQICLVAYPGVTALDLIGPQFFLAAAASGADVRVAATGKSTTIVTENGLQIIADTTFDTVEHADVIVVPGSAAGLVAALDDRSFLDRLAALAETATHVTSVCTGSMILAAAGLLTGRRATSHWATRPQLAAFGAIAVDERIVTDGHITTAAGVTAGIDLGVELIRRLRGDVLADAMSVQAELHTPTPPAFSDVAEILADMMAPLCEQIATLATDTTTGPVT